MRNIRFNKIRKFFFGGPVFQGQAPYLTQGTSIYSPEYKALNFKFSPEFNTNFQGINQGLNFKPNPIDQGLYKSMQGIFDNFSLGGTPPLPKPITPSNHLSQSVDPVVNSVKQNQIPQPQQAPPLTEPFDSNQNTTSKPESPTSNTPYKSQIDYGKLASKMGEIAFLNTGYKANTPIDDDAAKEILKGQIDQNTDPEKVKQAAENALKPSNTSRASLLSGLEIGSPDPVANSLLSDNASMSKQTQDLLEVTSMKEKPLPTKEELKNLLPEDQRSTAGLEISKEAQGADGFAEDPKKETGKSVSVSSPTGSTDKKWTEWDAEKAKNIGEAINKGMQFAQVGMRALGANDNDSKGTALASYGMSAVGEMAGQFGVAGKAVQAGLAGAEVADQILAKSHIGQFNNTFSKDTHSFERVGGSYGDVLDEANEAERLSGLRHGKFGLFGWSKQKADNAKIALAQKHQFDMADISNKNEDLKSASEAMSDINHINHFMFINGGFNPNYVRSAKEGGTLEETNIKTIIDFDDFVNAKTIMDYDDFVQNIEQFRSGGAIKSPNNIESDENVIPEGALHKNKHHLKANTGLDDTEYTKKGIPVLDLHGEQQAEIELNEIIFSYEVTQFLEDSYEKYYDDNTSNAEKEKLALKVGEELVYQILENTIDNTGLIQVAKQGGNLNVSSIKQTESKYND